MAPQTKPHVVHVDPKSPPNWLNAAISTLSQRITSTLFGVSKDGKRDINSIYGYKTQLSFNDYYWMYKRGGLAKRIVDALPHSCWRDGIQVKVGDDQILVDQINILQSFCKFTQKIERADVLNRIGKFSVLYVGVPDGNEPSEPLGRARPDRLKEVYFTPYAEDGVQIAEWETDPTSQRFGQPRMYQLQTMSRGDSDKAIIQKPIRVHWSRVVHIAEGLLDNEVEGTPALEAVFNTLEDLIKTTGGAAEAYFRNARNRFALQTDPKFNSQIDATTKAALEEEAQRFQNDWQDFIRAGGIDVKPLVIPHNDPVGTAKVQIQILAGTTGIPQRILIGEGAGQLAGNEDKESYNQLIQDRKELYCSDWTMQVLRVLASAKMIDLPDDAVIFWPTPETLSAVDKADVATKNAQAFASIAAALSSPSVDGQISLTDALKIVFGDDEVAKVAIDESGDDGAPGDQSQIKTEASVQNARHFVDALHKEIKKTGNAIVIHR